MNSKIHKLWATTLKAALQRSKQPYSVQGSLAALKAALQCSRQPYSLANMASVRCHCLCKHNLDQTYGSKNIAPLQSDCQRVETSPFIGYVVSTNFWRWWRQNVHSGVAETARALVFYVAHTLAVRFASKEMVLLVYDCVKETRAWTK